MISEPPTNNSQSESFYKNLMNDFEVGNVPKMHKRSQASTPDLHKSLLVSNSGFQQQRNENNHNLSLDQSSLAALQLPSRKNSNLRKNGEFIQVLPEKKDSFSRDSPLAKRIKHTASAKLKPIKDATLISEQNVPCITEVNEAEETVRKILQRQAQIGEATRNQNQQKRTQGSIEQMKSLFKNEKAFQDQLPRQNPYNNSRKSTKPFFEMTNKEALSKTLNLNNFINKYLGSTQDQSNKYVSSDAEEISKV